MIERDLCLGFRALSEGIIRPDQLHDALAECLEAGDRPLALIIEARGWASFGQLGQLTMDLDRPSRGESTSRATPPANGEGASSLPIFDPDGSTASLLEPTTRPWAGPPGRSRPADDRPSGGGRYELVRVLGIGGLGKVWLARDAYLGREVALKELRDDRPAEPALVQRFVEEARITSRLEHPGIVAVYDMIERDGESRLPFYTMRFLAGRTLAGAVEAYHRRRAEGTATTLEFRGLLDAFTAVCQAVAFAHSRDVLHRDLKGSNVILGDFGEVFVIDWGLAKASKTVGDLASSPMMFGGAGRDETAPGSIIGTPGYIAPELASGEPADRRSDVYSLGAILYLILAGRPSYVGAAREVIRTLVERDPEPPRTLVDDAPAALEAVCLRAMARDPSLRYGSAGELAEEVRRWLADEPVLAYPEPLARRLARWARKHRAAVVAISAALASALIVQSIAIARLWEQERRTAEQKAQAIRQAARAETNLEVARQLSVRLFNIADDQLSPIPSTESVRAAIFDAGQQTFRRFLKESPGDPFLRHWTARIDRFSGNVHRLLNECEVAESSYRESIALLEGLAADSPDGLHGSNLAMTLGDFAEALGKVGRLREASATAGRAVEVAESMVATFPGRPEPGRALAKVLLDLASVEGQLGHPAEAARLAGRAVGLYEGLVKLPGRRRALLERLMMGSSFQVLAEARRELGQPDEALAAADRGVATTRSLLQDFPEDGDGPHLLGLLLLERAEACSALEGRRSDAGRDLAEALAIWGRLADRAPSNPRYREYAALALRARGALRAAQAPDEGAAEDLDESRRALESLANRFASISSYQAALARTLLEQGRLAGRLGQADRAVGWLERSVDFLEKVVGRTPEDGRDRRTLAEAKDERARALAAKAGTSPPPSKP